MSVALLSQSKNLSVALQSSWIACDNVFNERTASPTAKYSIPDHTYWSPALGTGNTDTQTAVDMEVPPELKKMLKKNQFSVALV